MHRYCHLIHHILDAREHFQTTTFSNQWILLGESYANFMSLYSFSARLLASVRFFPHDLQCIKLYLDTNNSWILVTKENLQRLGSSWSYFHRSLDFLSVQPLCFKLQGLLNFPGQRVKNEPMNPTPDFHSSIRMSLPGGEEKLLVI